MAVAFARTTRALAADRGQGAVLGMVIGAGLLAAWSAWFVLGCVTVWEVSRTAHVEVMSAPRVIATEAGGRLVANGIYAGRRVHAGEVLAEFESGPQRLRLAEAEARLAAFPARLAALHGEVTADRAALAGAASAGSAEVGAAGARARGADAIARYSSDLAGRQRADATAGGSAPVEAAHAEAEARHAEAESEALRHERVGSAGDARQRRAERASSLAGAEEALAAATAEQLATQALAGQLRLELAARRIVAPVDGVIGDVAAVRIGDVLPAGAHLGSLVPGGGLHVIASFDAATGLGRLAAGQSGRLRLDGFSWAQYGDFPARIEGVAADSSDGALRVDLAIPAESDGDVPLRHGMSGQVEVAVEQTSPALLVLRAIGRWLA